MAKYMAKKMTEVVTPEVSDSAVVEFEEVSVDASQIEQGIPLKFELLGDSISGVYERRGKQDAHGDFREQMYYDIRAESDGRLYRLFGNSNLNALMSKVRIGSRVIVEYINDEPIDGRPDYNPRKLHSVKVAKSDKVPTVTRGAARKL